MKTQKIKSRKKNCMFVSHERLGEIRNTFLTIGATQGSRLNRKAASPILDCSCNPKGSSAYKIIFDMHEENNFATINHIGIAQQRAKIAQRTSNEFFSLVQNYVHEKKPTEAINTLTFLLNQFMLAHAENNYTDACIVDTVYETLGIIEFLTNLKTNFTAFENANTK